MASQPAYMARLQDSRVRRLPPMAPIREVSHPSALNEPTAKPKLAPSKPKRSDVPEEYRYLVSSSIPEEPLRSEVWHPYEVNEVVDRYLNAAKIGAGNNPLEPTPNVLCECCNDINNENKRRKFEQHTHPHLKLTSEHPPLQNSLKYQSTKYEQPKIQTYSADYGIYRTESPELLSDSSHKPIPEYEAAALDRRKIFVTHPAKNSLYSNWGVRNEVESFGYDRHLAEDVVQASSNFIDAMERLKKISSS